MENEQKNIIKELAELLHKNNLTEIDYHVADVHIRVVGARGVVPIQAEVAPQPVAPVPAPAAPVVEDKNLIRSPIVGVVYLAQNPESAPFVKVGDHVSAGQTLCLVEAMKTFNPIKAVKNGTVKAVLVESGSPVEYDQPLFEIA